MTTKDELAKALRLRTVDLLSEVQSLEDATTPKTVWDAIFEIGMTIDELQSWLSQDGGKLEDFPCPY